MFSARKSFFGEDPLRGSEVDPSRNKSGTPLSYVSSGFSDGSVTMGSPCRVITPHDVGLVMS